MTELTPCETENPMGGYGKTISHVIIGLKTAKGTKQLKVSPWGSYLNFPVLCGSGDALTSAWVLCTVAVGLHRC